MSAAGHEADREARRRELAKLTKARLISMCRAGIVKPGGGRAYVEGGMYPLEQWRKDEVISAILPIEHPSPCPGCVGRGTGETCCVCGLPVPEELRRSPGDAPEYDQACPQCATGARHAHALAAAS